MADERKFGGIASKVLMENDRVRIWEMRLAPGEESSLHKHELDYIMIQVAGDKMAARFEPDSGGEWVGLDYVEGEIRPGNVLYAKRGGIETAVNVGKEEFYEIVVELKD
jgi:beta-alanine degradation protein BauB